MVTVRPGGAGLTLSATAAQDCLVLRTTVCGALFFAFAYDLSVSCVPRARLSSDFWKFAVSEMWGSDGAASWRVWAVLGVFIISEV